MTAGGVSRSGADITSSPQEVLRASKGENFPVAPIVLPKRVRRHLNAVYGFARLIDDLGDEAGGDRLALIDAYEADLELVWSGTPSIPVNRGLVATVRECGLAPEPFHRLVAANRQDQTVARYETFDELLRYCTLSADPVGHLVLGVFGLATPERLALSDRVCTALQLAEHCQDVAEDYQAGRVYLPLEDMAAFGVREEDLAQPVAGRAVRDLLAFQVSRARDILDSGAPLVGLVPGRLRFAIAGFVGGGRSALEAIRRADHEVLSATRSATKRSLFGHALVALAAASAPSTRRRSSPTVPPPLVAPLAAEPPAAEPPAAEPPVTAPLVADLTAAGSSPAASELTR
jgi:squalene synthase HpnC